MRRWLLFVGLAGAGMFAACGEQGNEVGGATAVDAAAEGSVEPSGQDPDGEGPTPTGPGPEVAESGWSRLPDPPLVGRTSAVVADVGGRLFVAGGWNFLCPPGADCAAPSDEPFADGAMYDVDAGTWTETANAPVGFWAFASAVVGPDVYALSQCDEAPNCPAGRSILRYRSDDDAWDVLPAPDRDGSYDLVAFGSSLVAYSQTDEIGPHADYLLGPGDEWSPLPDDQLPLVFDRQAVADDGSLYLFGSPIDSEDPSKLGAVFDPDTQTWTPLPSGGGGYQVWAIGRRFYLNPHFGDSYRGGIFDPDTGSWADLPDPPRAESWRSDMAGVLSNDAARYEYGQGWALDARTRMWVEIPRRPDSEEVSDETVASIGNRLVVAGGQAWSGGDGELLNHVWMWTPPSG